MRDRHVVLLNWRDAEHPQAGGAEAYCHAVAERIARGGAKVTLVTARAPRQDRVSERGGITIVRGGGRFGVYPFALAWLLRHRGDVDAVIDFQNGIPFFSPLAAPGRLPVVGVLHHVHQEQFALHFPEPLARVGRLLEGPVSRLVYRNRPLIAVSPSTREEARRMLRWRGFVHVVPNGLDVDVLAARRDRTVEPSIVCVGRLVVQKRLDLLVNALASVPGVRLDVVGSGPDRARLEQLTRARGLQHRVRFHGRVDGAVRDALLDRAWLTVNPAAREGWGLSILEANARGVPALAFRVPGLRDAVRPGVTGWLAEPGTPLADAILAALGELADPDVAARYATGAIGWARSFSWDRTAEHIVRVVSVEAGRLRRADPSDRRTRTDLVTRVDLPADPVTRARLYGTRRSDTWHFGERTFTGLLYGADESDAEALLRRLHIDEHASIRVARTSDLLEVGPAAGGRR